MKEINVSVLNICKSFKLYLSPRDRLKEAIHPFRKQYHRPFDALKNISFNVRAGDTLGILGKNGSGKSTLLKVLCGVLKPTRGEYEISGKISSLLELGTGFNPEATGYENIFFYGLIVGLTREEMEERVQEIVDFADIGEYIHQPVKVYSSGMFVRLAFSVAINVDPDILVIDEALSVGDISFQQKCFYKFNEFKEKKKTIILVTHSLENILQYCDRAIVLDGGSMVEDTTAKGGVDCYKKLLVNCYNFKDDSKRDISFKDVFDCNKSALQYGDGQARIIDYGIYDKEGNPVKHLLADEHFTIKFKIKFYSKVKDLILAFTIKNLKGIEITGTNTNCESKYIPDCEIGDVVEVSFDQILNLRPDQYALSLGCVSECNGTLFVHDRLYDIILFEVVHYKNFVGFYDPKSTISISKLS